MTDINYYDFDLPEELIAHTPLPERDRCRLLVVDRLSHSFYEKTFRDIVDYLERGDVLVLNNSKVVKSRIYAKCERTQKEHEMLITNFLKTKEFLALVRKIKRLRVGDILTIRNFKFTFKGVENGLGLFESDKPFSVNDLEEIGEIPLPPYIEKKREKLNLPRVTEADNVFYQTVYSSVAGSIASPTAGLHFTEELLKEIERKGVLIRYVTLHIGLGTFEPIRTKNIEEFRLKGEYMEIEKEVIDDIIECKKRGNKIVAVGTTVVRALETTFLDISKNRNGFKGITELFIYPGFKFNVVDNLITNFHLPKSSLILLVSAFAGKDLIMKAYSYAIEKKFRFYSYGDAMLIV
ncbi:MAG: tRNA preQ1(34) S-adenosylmethionine ribosyltransferase-isomerase QueA [Brevinematia bacterium]